MLSTNMHMESVELRHITCPYYQISIPEMREFNTSATLFPYIAHILFALHLVYEVSVCASFFFSTYSYKLDLFKDQYINLNILLFSYLRII